MTAPIVYGPNSPFDAEERDTIEAVYNAVLAVGDDHADDVSSSIRRDMACLEWLGEVVSQYPSPLGTQNLGEMQRNLDTLMDSLSQTNPANFEFFLPTRALLGRAMDMAETNLYRFLRHICKNVLPESPGEALRIRVSERLRVCLYTKLVEELLSVIASDDLIERDVRRKAIESLALLWEGRLTYRVQDFFPLLEATWAARSKINVVGGTLIGTQEVFQLFQEGCDPEFVEFFGRPDHSKDEKDAFLEFLFGASSEKIEQLTEEMNRDGTTCVKLSDTIMLSRSDIASIFYEFYRSRQMLATARRLADLPGPKRTAEGYVLIHYLQQMK